MLIVTLTGGIGSGKTTVSRQFEALGVPVVDTDLLARELVEPGQVALEEICQQLGHQVINQDGSLNRAELRKLVFNAPEQRKILEAILHPRIRKLTLERLDAIDSPYAIVVIPLLLESGMANPGHLTLVVDIPKALQNERVQARDGLSQQQVEKIIQAQVGRQQRLDVADDVIENGAAMHLIKERVAQLHQHYLALAKNRAYK
ncbi:MAG: dephospho-CoA kinase [Candidatus Polarisedimenticolaceae bacterium]|nr:dephospho-CoA kinase [Candidatus Polarisedimenticolaceae bacterium]